MLHKRDPNEISSAETDFFEMVILNQLYIYSFISITHMRYIILMNLELSCDYKKPPGRCLLPPQLWHRQQLLPQNVSTRSQDICGTELFCCPHLGELLLYQNTTNPTSFSHCFNCVVIPFYNSISTSSVRSSML